MKERERMRGEKRNRDVNLTTAAGNGGSYIQKTLNNLFLLVNLSIFLSHIEQYDSISIIDLVHFRFFHLTFII